MRTPSYVKAAMLSISVLAPLRAQESLKGLTPLAVHASVEGSKRSAEIEKQLVDGIYKALKANGIPITPPTDLPAEDSPFLHMQLKASRIRNGYIYFLNFSVKIPAENKYNSTRVYAVVASRTRMAHVDTNEQVNSAASSFTEECLKQFLSAWRLQNKKIESAMPESNAKVGIGEPSDETKSPI